MVAWLCPKPVTSATSAARTIRSAETQRLNYGAVGTGSLGSAGARTFNSNFFGVGSNANSGYGYGNGVMDMAAGDTATAAVGIQIRGM